MPIYEYLCLECQNPFDALRPMSQADAPIVCENCESEHITRMISVFSARSGSGALSVDRGGCACGGACSCASLN